MNVKINESKFKKLLFDYLDSIHDLRYAKEHRSGYGNSVREFFSESTFNDDMEPDYQHEFTYYRTPEDYDDINGVSSPYDKSEYPLIEMDHYNYQKIINLFGDVYTPKLIIEWLNNLYGLDAISIFEN